jgi:hypothetical protein
MKTIIVAHCGDPAERERAFDLVNKCRHGGISFLIADLNSQVINLDVLRLRLPHADALLIVQSSYMVSQAPLHEESEVNRAERLAMEAATKSEKVCGIIGKRPTLLSSHVLSSASKIHVVGPFCEPRDVTGGLTNSFSVADIMHVSDMDRGVQAFMTKLEQRVLENRKRLEATAA